MEQRQPTFEEYHRLLMEVLETKNEEIKVLRTGRSNSNGGYWKVLATAAGTALAAFAGLWLTFGQNAVTKADVKELIETRVGPLHDTLKSHELKLEDMRIKIWNVETTQKVVKERLRIPAQEQE